MDIQILQSKLEILSHLGIKSTDLVRMEGPSQGYCANPSLLTYDFHNKVKPVIAIYESVGLSKGDLITVLLCRPTLVPRTTLDDEKIDYIRKTGVSKESKMYKHVVSLFAISRIETIRDKRHMTFILGTMRLSANVVLRNPFLLYFNLETVLKPRFQLACEIEDMGLVPHKGPALLRALRMSDKQFISAFITCHPETVAEELITAFKNAKCVR
ncbi:UNVERIFIED_CONTAM: hypothetical protein Sradi_0861100 [Sesamum radiatum]|uniref:Uncharacterized protein n=1 Tax=Sesamum radiatum TaxID=300843 RepID=A0AAW2V255_SESRA